MKVHYINILLFVLPLNILVNTHRKPSITPHDTQTDRSLCECELYEPANYDNDPQMKSVMDNFNKQAQQRFQEYDASMETTRQKCKDQCDKEIQKIILKDKLEKQMAQQFSTLHMDIQSDSIPTCVCEKSLADKMEKVCLRCGGVFGGGVAPSVGLLGGIGEFGLSVWKPAALAAAKEFAEKAGAAQGVIAGKARGMAIVNKILEQKGIAEYCPHIFKSIQKIESFTELKGFVGPIIEEHSKICWDPSTNGAMCTQFDIELGAGIPGVRPGLPPNDAIKKLLEELAGKADQTAKAIAKNTAKDVAASITKEKTSEIAATYASWETTIIAAVVAIVVIVLVMIIIYLVLRYRRKKKMKKKLQYIKLLEE